MPGLDSIRNSALAIRVLPFVIFVVITSLQGSFGVESKYWLYLLKSLLGVGLIAWMWPVVREMRWNFSWEAVVAGIAVFVLWIGLEPFYPDLDELKSNEWVKKIWPGSVADPVVAAIAPQWNPLNHFSATPFLGWFFVVVRIVGMSLVVPPLEEVFYRSFLYRYIKHPDFEKIPLGNFSPAAFVVSCLIFGIAHNEWLAGIICAAIYQGLVIRKKRLGDAITAHLITNLLLGCYVVWKGAYKFW